MAMRDGAAVALQVVLALDDEVGAPDGAGELRFLSGEFEGGKFVGDSHAVAQFETHRPLGLVAIERVKNVNDEATLVENVGPAHIVDDEGRGLEGRGVNDN